MVYSNEAWLCVQRVMIWDCTHKRPDHAFSLIVVDSHWVPVVSLSHDVSTFMISNQLKIILGSEHIIFTPQTSAHSCGAVLNISVQTAYSYTSQMLFNIWYKTLQYSCISCVCIPVVLPVNQMLMHRKHDNKFTVNINLIFIRAPFLVLSLVLISKL